MSPCVPVSSRVSGFPPHGHRLLFVVFGSGARGNRDGRHPEESTRQRRAWYVSSNACGIPGRLPLQWKAAGGWQSGNDGRLTYNVAAKKKRRQEEAEEDLGDGLQGTQGGEQMQRFIRTAEADYDEAKQGFCGRSAAL